MDLKSKFRGSLLGTAIGDSLGGIMWGVSAAFVDVEKIFELQQIRYSDDTQMMIGVAESLIERGEFDGEHMSRKFVENYDSSRGYGLGCSWVIQKIRGGTPWETPAKELFGGEGSYGNGSSMRIAPIGVLYHYDPKRLREIARESSKITHTHELGIEGKSRDQASHGR